MLPPDLERMPPGWPTELGLFAMWLVGVGSFVAAGSPGTGELLLWGGGSLALGFCAWRALLRQPVGTLLELRPHCFRLSPEEPIESRSDLRITTKPLERDQLRPFLLENDGGASRLVLVLGDRHWSIGDHLREGERAWLHHLLEGWRGGMSWERICAHAGTRTVVSG